MKTSIAAIGLSVMLAAASARWCRSICAVDFSR